MIDGGVGVYAINAIAWGTGTGVGATSRYGVGIEATGGELGGRFVGGMEAFSGNSRSAGYFRAGNGSDPNPTDPDNYRAPINIGTFGGSFGGHTVGDIWVEDTTSSRRICVRTNTAGKRCVELDL